MLDMTLLASLSVTDGRTIASGVIMCVIALVSIALIVLVLLQRGSGDSVSAITGGNSESFFSKNKGNSTQRVLRLLTVILSVVLAILAIVFFIVVPTNTGVVTA